MLLIRSCSLLLLLCCASEACAQTKPSSSQPSAAQPSAAQPSAATRPGSPPRPSLRPADPRDKDSTTAEAYSEPRSRELFQACDADGDDRLDLFEAIDALEGMGEFKDATGFRRLDRDRDGFLSFAEFDQHFRSLSQSGKTLRIRPARRPAATSSGEPTAAKRFLQLYDRNQDNALDAEEIAAFAKQAGLGPNVVQQLRALDQDHSGKLEEGELGPYLASNPLLQMMLQRGSQRRGPLPPPWNEVDADGNGEIDAAELQAMLRRLDPALLRWADLLLAKADKDRDGKLQASELGLRPVVTTAQPPKN